MGRPPCRIPSVHTAPRAVFSGRQCRICMRKQCPPRQSSVVKAQGLDYKQAGVDIDAGAELVRRIQKLNPSIGGFSGLVPFGGCNYIALVSGLSLSLLSVIANLQETRSW